MTDDVVTLRKAGTYTVCDARRLAQTQALWEVSQEVKSSSLLALLIPKNRRC